MSSDPSDDTYTQHPSSLHDIQDPIGPDQPATKPTQQKAKQLTPAELARQAELRRKQADEELKKLESQGMNPFATKSGTMGGNSAGGYDLSLLDNSMFLTDLDVEDQDIPITTYLHSQAHAQRKKGYDKAAQPDNINVGNWELVLKALKSERERNPFAAAVTCCIAYFKRDIFTGFQNVLDVLIPHLKTCLATTKTQLAELFNLYIGLHPSHAKQIMELFGKYYTQHASKSSVKAQSGQKEKIKVDEKYAPDLAEMVELFIKSYGTHVITRSLLVGSGFLNCLLAKSRESCKNVLIFTYFANGVDFGEEVLKFCESNKVNATTVSQFKLAITQIESFFETQKTDKTATCPFQIKPTHTVKGLTAPTPDQSGGQKKITRGPKVDFFEKLLEEYAKVDQLERDDAESNEGKAPPSGGSTAQFSGGTQVASSGEKKKSWQFDIDRLAAVSTVYKKYSNSEFSPSKPPRIEKVTTSIKNGLKHAQSALNMAALTAIITLYEDLSLFSQLAAGAHQIVPLVMNLFRERKAYIIQAVSNACAIIYNNSTLIPNMSPEKQQTAQQIILREMYSHFMKEIGQKNPNYTTNMLFFINSSIYGVDVNKSYLYRIPGTPVYKKVWFDFVKCVVGLTDDADDKIRKNAITSISYFKQLLPDKLWIEYVMNKFSDPNKKDNVKKMQNIVKEIERSVKMTFAEQVNVQLAKQQQQQQHQERHQEDSNMKVNANGKMIKQEEIIEIVTEIVKYPFLHTSTYAYPILLEELESKFTTALKSASELPSSSPPSPPSPSSQSPHPTTSSTHSYYQDLTITIVDPQFQWNQETSSANSPTFPTVTHPILAIDQITSLLQDIINYPNNIQPYTTPSSLPLTQPQYDKIAGSIYPELKDKFQTLIATPLSEQNTIIYPSLSTFQAPSSTDLPTTSSTPSSITSLTSTASNEAIEKALTMLAQVGSILTPNHQYHFFRLFWPLLFHYYDQPLLQTTISPHTLSTLNLDQLVRNADTNTPSQSRSLPQSQEPPISAHSREESPTAASSASPSPSSTPPTSPYSAIFSTTHGLPKSTNTETISKLIPSSPTSFLTTLTSILNAIPFRSLTYAQAISLIRITFLNLLEPCKNDPAIILNFFTAISTHLSLPTTIAILTDLVKETIKTSARIEILLQAFYLPLCTHYNLFNLQSAPYFTLLTTSAKSPSHIWFNQCYRNFAQQIKTLFVESASNKVATLALQVLFEGIYAQYHLTTTLYTNHGISETDLNNPEDDTGRNAKEHKRGPLLPFFESTTIAPEFLKTPYLSLIPPPTIMDKIVTALPKPNPPKSNKLKGEKKKIDEMKDSGCFAVVVNGNPSEIRSVCTISNPAYPALAAQYGSDESMSKIEDDKKSKVPIMDKTITLKGLGVYSNQCLPIHDEFGVNYTILVQLQPLTMTCEKKRIIEVEVDVPMSSDNQALADGFLDHEVPLHGDFQDDEYDADGNMVVPDHMTAFFGAGATAAAQKPQSVRQQQQQGAQQQAAMKQTATQKRQTVAQQQSQTGVGQKITAPAAVKPAQTAIAGQKGVRTSSTVANAMGSNTHGGGGGANSATAQTGPPDPINQLSWYMTNLENKLDVKKREIALTHLHTVLENIHVAQQQYQAQQQQYQALLQQPSGQPLPPFPSPPPTLPQVVLDKLIPLCVKLAIDTAAQRCSYQAIRVIILFFCCFSAELRKSLSSIIIPLIKIIPKTKATTEVMHILTISVPMYTFRVLFGFIIQSIKAVEGMPLTTIGATSAPPPSAMSMGHKFEQVQLLLRFVYTQICYLNQDFEDLLVQFRSLQHQYSQYTGVAIEDQAYLIANFEKINFASKTHQFVHYSVEKQQMITNYEQQLHQKQIAIHTLQSEIHLYITNVDLLYILCEYSRSKSSDVKDAVMQLIVLFGRLIVDFRQLTTPILKLKHPQSDFIIKSLYTKYPQHRPIAGGSGTTTSASAATKPKTTTSTSTAPSSSSSSSSIQNSTLYDTTALNTTTIPTQQQSLNTTTIAPSFNLHQLLSSQSNTFTAEQYKFLATSVFKHDTPLVPLTNTLSFDSAHHPLQQKDIELLKTQLTIAFEPHIASMLIETVENSTRTGVITANGSVQSSDKAGGQQQGNDSWKVIFDILSGLARRIPTLSQLYASYQAVDKLCTQLKTAQSQQSQQQSQQSYGIGGIRRTTMGQNQTDYNQLFTAYQSAYHQFTFQQRLIKQHVTHLDLLLRWVAWKVCDGNVVVIRACFSYLMLLLVQLTTDTEIDFTPSSDNNSNGQKLSQNSSSIYHLLGLQAVQSADLNTTLQGGGVRVHLSLLDFYQTTISDATIAIITYALTHNTSQTSLPTMTTNESTTSICLVHLMQIATPSKITHSLLRYISKSVHSNNTRTSIRLLTLLHTILKQFKDTSCIPAHFLTLLHDPMKHVDQTIRSLSFDCLAVWYVLVKREEELNQLQHSSVSATDLNSTQQQQQQQQQQTLTIPHVLSMAAVQPRFHQSVISVLEKTYLEYQQQLITFGQLHTSANPTSTDGGGGGGNLFSPQKGGYPHNAGVFNSTAIGFDTTHNPGTNNTMDSHGTFPQPELFEKFKSQDHTSPPSTPHHQQHHQPHSFNSPVPQRISNSLHTPPPRNSTLKTPLQSRNQSQHQDDANAKLPTITPIDIPSHILNATLFFPHIHTLSLLLEANMPFDNLHPTTITPLNQTAYPLPPPPPTPQASSNPNLVDLNTTLTSLAGHTNYSLFDTVFNAIISPITLPQQQLSQVYYTPNLYNFAALPSFHTEHDYLFTQDPTVCTSTHKLGFTPSSTKSLINKDKLIYSNMSYDIEVVLSLSVLFLTILYNPSLRYDPNFGQIQHHLADYITVTSRHLQHLLAPEILSLSHPSLLEEEPSYIELLTNRETITQQLIYSIKTALSATFLAFHQHHAQYHNTPSHQAYLTSLRIDQHTIQRLCHVIVGAFRIPVLEENISFHSTSLIFTSSLYYLSIQTTIYPFNPIPTIQANKDPITRALNKVVLAIITSCCFNYTLTIAFSALLEQGQWVQTLFPSDVLFSKQIASQQQQQEQQQQAENNTLFHRTISLICRVITKITKHFDEKHTALVQSYQQQQQQQQEREQPNEEFYSQYIQYPSIFPLLDDLFQLFPSLLPSLNHYLTAQYHHPQPQHNDNDKKTISKLTSSIIDLLSTFPQNDSREQSLTDAAQLQFDPPQQINRILALVQLFWNTYSQQQPQRS